MEVLVQGKHGMEMGIRKFRKLTQKEGIIKEARRRAEFENKSEKARRKSTESKLLKKRPTKTN